MRRKLYIHGSIFKDNKTFEFTKVDKKYKIFEERDFKEHLTKWNMEKNLKLLSYSFHGDVREGEREQIIENLFRSSDVLMSIGCKEFLDSDGKDLAIEIEPVPCNILSMELFDRIYDNGIVISDGTIRKCFEDYVDDIVIADELRTMLLLEGSENYSLYSEDERKEFLFRIFQHFCLGGNLNQYEDNIEPYIMISKALYKDIMCVRKSGVPKKISIKSEIFKVVCYKDDVPVYPTSKQHYQDFAYIILNMPMKQVSVLHHIW
ncbi:cilia- and flagella-associated protein 300-like [Stegodyphus dumicola]|uniref:cilia- and flagella-associated protein 300-like n=1 Tax=Stegodyphus dumicola TaxID=202533 RepID=UPI0015AB9FEB|nr:cilia- and flagella-associated protein 300-like [Stegodyphus dumicola]